MKLRRRAVRFFTTSLAAAAMAGSVLVPRASAEPVRADFYLTLTSTFGDMAALGGVPLVAGDRVRGTLVYDASAPSGRPDLGYAEYRPSGSITLGFGTGVVLPLEGMIVVESYFVNGILQPAFVGAFGFTESFPGFDSIQAELEFRGGAGTGTSLPGSASDLFRRYPRGFLRGAAWQTGVNPPFDSGTQEFFATITPVPEPGTLLMVGGGVAMLIRRLRGQRRAITATLQ